MKLNMIANMARSQRGEPVTIEKLRAELKEARSLKAVTARQKLLKQRHIAALEAIIELLK